MACNFAEMVLNSNCSAKQIDLQVRRTVLEPLEGTVIPFMGMPRLEILNRVVRKLPALYQTAATSAGAMGGRVNA